jgi:hypothetical protein
MNLNEFSKEVHKNAVDHGWWEGERALPETLALIHSEWSEALEEARAGRPMVYRVCHEDPEEEMICNPQDLTDCTSFGKEKDCKYYGKKPEGIAVELIDGCIRILDLIGKSGIQLQKHYTLEELMKDVPAAAVPEELSHLVTLLHWYISMVYAAPKGKGISEGPAAFRERVSRLFEAMGIACVWVKKHGCDPEKLLIEKHEYNRTRPYKHGKKF